MTFVNLTPHNVNVILEDRTITYHPSVSPARVVQIAKLMYMTDGVPISTVRFGAVQGLPGPASYVRYIVSAKVKRASPDRDDLLSPGELVRNEKGEVIGCKGFFC